LKEAKINLKSLGAMKKLLTISLHLHPAAMFFLVSRSQTLYRTRYARKGSGNRQYFDLSPQKKKNAV